LIAQGWFKERKLNLDPTQFSNSIENQNALKILEEYGGLRFISPEKREEWTLTLVEFPLDTFDLEVKDFGLDKTLTRFATAHNDHIDLFVDRNNVFYQLDNVVSDTLYEYKSQTFEHLMRELLKIEEYDELMNNWKQHKRINSNI